MIADQEMEHWDDCETLGRQRRWFTSDVAKRLLSIHKPVGNANDAYGKEELVVHGS